ncbi:hypothetical protein Tsubulata_017426 [Turnera subulata]|uniref:RRM domain-containing protein n=1 Tax=Turnera subulata TaxID=218843 RepID=A0A9Q0JD87_9ROSI|nr:hypothetical protein Tsubulata_017426 [Turnera subulata]
MPFEIIDQRGGNASSHFLDEIRFPSERQNGFWKQHIVPDPQGIEGMTKIPGSKLPASSPSGNFSVTAAPSVDHVGFPQSFLAQKGELLINEGNANMSKTSWNSVDNHSSSWSNVSSHPASHIPGRIGDGVTGNPQWESSLFSSSLSEIFTRKLRLHGNDSQPHRPSRTVFPPQEEEENCVSLEEMEAQTIGNLLPAEDDLLSGVTEGLGRNAHVNGGDDLEEFDLFSSVGGMELEGDDLLSRGHRNSDFVGSIIGGHPSRTLFVRNINSNVEDSELKAVFEQYGDIRTLYTACKHRGFVMISYYDIRAAQKAMRALQNKPLRRRQLDIHYSIPKDNLSEQDVNQGMLVVSNLDSSVSTDELHKIFGFYGEIKEIRETSHEHHQKLIEYYDVRAAEAALSALNKSDIAGKQIKLESAGTRRLMQQGQFQDEPNACQGPFDDLSSAKMALSNGIIASSSMDFGSTQGLNSTILSPAGVFVESRQSSSVPNNFPSPATVTSIGSQFSRHEHNHTLDDIKFGNQCLPTFHPQSIPEYLDNLANAIPCNSSTTVRDIAGGFVSTGTEVINGKHIRGVGANGHLVELNGGAFGSPGSGSHSLPGHHYIWNSPNSGPQQPSSRMVWPNSPSFVNGVQSNHLQQMPGFPRPHPVMLNTPPVHHHIGSAPAVNQSLWDRPHSYAGESPEASTFHLGSLGSIGFHGSSPSHPMEIASHNMFSRVGENCLDMTKNAVIRSPSHMRHMFPGRSPMISVPVSFDSPNERVRNLSHRRIESNSNHSDKRQYELDIDRILRGEDSRTTLMIKNIPNKYTSKMLLAAIDEHCRGTYDFIYLPIDFKNKCNVGYAFINMTDPQQIIPFHKAFNGKKWEKFNSEKVASLAYARIQGKAALIAHFQNSSLMNEDKRCRPILFHTDGPNAGDPEPFPMGTNIRSRLGKPRTSGNEESHYSRNSSSSVNGEDSSNGSNSPSGSD